MKAILESINNNNYYVSLAVEERHDIEIYSVQVCPCQDNTRCGRVEKEITYSIKDKEKAYATYKRYVKKYCQQTG